jgi:hypothetical protein
VESRGEEKRSVRFGEEKTISGSEISSNRYKRPNLNAEPISEMKEKYEGGDHDSEDPDETLMENR